MENNEVDKSDYKFNLKNVKFIIDDVEQTFKQNIDKIVPIINSDNNIFSEKITYSKLFEITNQLKLEKWCLEKKSKNIIIDGVGNIAVVYDGNPYVLLYMCLKALKTHNNITFFETTEVHGLSSYIADVISNSAKCNDYFVDIKTVKIDKLSDISKYEDKFEKFITIGEYTNYNLLKLYIKKEIIYSAYGTLSLYMDDKSIEKELLEMDDYVFNNNIKLDLYTEGDVDAVVNKINMSHENFCSVIFSRDIKKVSKFMNHVNSSMIFVNKNPFKHYKFEIEDFKLIKLKKIYL